MEVHHHSHTSDPDSHRGRKKWTHYLWEFLMLFLAVFCGFLAENQREHMVEHQREKQFMISLAEDLELDTALLQAAIMGNEYVKNGMDTLREVIYRIGFDNNAIRKIYVYSRQYLRPIQIEYIDRTSSQLKNSGAMRLIRNKKVAAEIMNYWSGIERTGFLQDRGLSFLNKAIDLRNKILDSRYFIDADYNMEIFPVKDKPVLLNSDPRLLSEYANLIYQAQQLHKQKLRDCFYDQFNKATALINTIKKEYHLK